ncbi:MAG TPA: LysM peptidoglycan-binding domain-containing protein [Thermoanaerobaculia bacterium]|nr:LysM peptidoglycan-binding domain-containing protein [Thermoanaerobaculia bacterium]
MRRVAPVLLLVIATSAFAQRQTSQPPRDLHRVGDHWTAYNPPDPSTYPAGAKTHEIKAGDTLWGLAQQYYNNGYLWPQLWESNTWITDAHWIYPGDVLLVTGEGQTTAEATTGGTTTAGGSTMVEGDNAFTAATDEEGTAIARVTPATNPIPLATESDIFCYGYIGHPDEPMPNYVESHEDVEVKYVPKTNPSIPGTAAQGDLIYVHGGAASGLVAGETYLAVEPGDLIHHPATGALLGRHYDYVGQIRILCVEGNQSRAMVTESCREIRIGARLKPLPQLPIPIARVPELPAWCDPPTGQANGYIIDSRGWDLGLVEGTLIQINLGSEDQIEPGDFMTVYRPSLRSDQPRVVLGEIGILTTQEKTATAVIVAARREMLVGDQVELR